MFSLSFNVHAERMGGTEGSYEMAPQSAGSFVPTSAASFARPAIPPAGREPNPDVHRTGGPIGLAAILIGAGMRVLGNVIARNFSRRSAEKVAEQYAKKIMEKKGKCWSMKGADGQRILLGADKETVLFAGAHDAYELFIKRHCH